LYLFFIGESLGWQELILIGVVALIFLGPRKLPQLAKTIGKTMADFRKISTDFKSTWEKEVEEDSKMLKTFASDPEMDTPAIKSIEQSSLAAPQVKELNPAEIEKLFPKKDIQLEAETPIETVKAEEVQPEPVTLSKRDWL
jgi:sec-independent protein translocase protein TatB